MKMKSKVVLGFVALVSMSLFNGCDTPNNVLDSTPEAVSAEVTSDLQKIALNVSSMAKLESTNSADISTAKSKTSRARALRSLRSSSGSSDESTDMNYGDAVPEYYEGDSIVDEYEYEYEYDEEIYWADENEVMISEGVYVYTYEFETDTLIDTMYLFKADGTTPLTWEEYDMDEDVVTRYISYYKNAKYIYREDITYSESYSGTDLDSLYEFYEETSDLLDSKPYETSDDGSGIGGCDPYEYIEEYEYSYKSSAEGFGSIEYYTTGFRITIPTIEMVSEDSYSSNSYTSSYLFKEVLELLNGKYTVTYEEMFSFDDDDFDDDEELSDDYYGMTWKADIKDITGDVVGSFELDYMTEEVTIYDLNGNVIDGSVAVL